MSPRSTIRRLLKSRLRLHILRALESERPNESWASIAEVEQGISEDAWEAWTKVRAHVFWEVREAAQALDEAVASTSESFRGVVDESWLSERVRSFVQDFRAEQLMEGPCASPTS